MGSAVARRAFRWSDETALALLAASKLLLHFLLNGRYGFWIDELYFIACGEHLAWGYVDQPPLIAVVAKASRLLLGDSLFAIRFCSAVAGAALVYLAGAMARELGGGRAAMLLAGLCVIVAPVYLAFGNLLTMNSFEALSWTLCAYVVVLIIKRDRPGLWLLFGLIAGISLLNKHSMAFFGFALVAGLLLTPQRRLLFGPWAWAAALLAVAVFSPNLLWQAEHGWPTIELLRNARLYQHQPVGPLGFVLQQVLLINPVTLPVCWMGLLFYLRSDAGRPYRALGWSYIVLFGLFVVLQAKNYYLAPIYPMLFAAGAVRVEQRDRARSRSGRRRAIIFVVAGLIVAPYVLPVLPVEWVPVYMSAIGIKEPRPERRKVGRLPQVFSDMLGWEERVAAVARAYGSLSAEERQRVVIWSPSYGSAGAVDFFGHAYGLPPAISGYQNYYLWGTHGYSGDLVIAVGYSTERLRPLFDSVELTEVVECDLCMPDLQRTPVHICRGIHVPLQKLWPRLKCYTCDQPALWKKNGEPAGAAAGAQN